MVTTLCLSGAAMIKAGKGINDYFSGANAETYLDPLINQAEGVVCGTCRYNFIDNYATLNTDVKHILEEVTSNLAAIYAIQYDFSGYTSRIEAEDMINILRDAALRGLSILRDKKVQDFIIGA